MSDAADEVSSLSPEKAFPEAALSEAPGHISTGSRIASPTISTPFLWNFPTFASVAASMMTFVSTLCAWRLYKGVIVLLVEGEKTDELLDRDTVEYPAVETSHWLELAEVGTMISSPGSAEASNDDLTRSLLLEDGEIS